MVFWTFGLKLNTSNVGIAVAWRDKNFDKQNKMRIFFWKNKNIFDAEL